MPRTISKILTEDPSEVNAATAEIEANEQTIKKLQKNIEKLKAKRVKLDPKNFDYDYFDEKSQGYPNRASPFDDA